MSVVVSYNGTPLTKGNVVFAPVDSSKAKGATGEIGSGGKLTPTTTRPGDGLVAGEYKVSVTSYAADPINTPPAQLAAMKNGGLAVPKKYIDVGTSGLTISVTPADSGKEIKIELKD